MMTRTLLCAVPLIAAFSTANAACPQRSDLANGIYVTFTDESVSAFRSRADGTVSEWIHDGSDTALALDVIQGVHIVREYDVKNGTPDLSSERTYTYDGPFMAPEDGASQSLNVVISVSPKDLQEDPDAKPSNEVYTVRYGPVSTLQIGSCSYSSQIVALVYELPDGRVHDSRQNDLPVWS